MKFKTTIATGTTLAAIALSASAQITYNGNGATGFGGPVGNGSLTISDTASSLTFTLNRGSSGALNDVLVVYLDTQAGGFTDNSTFSDNGDGGRTAISGANTGNPSRTLVTFAPGFGADYAIEIENDFIGFFQLFSGGNNSLNFLFGLPQSANNLAANYTVSLSAAQMGQIGLTAGAGQTFGFEGTLISGSAYRSNEAIGNSLTVAADGAGNPGFSNPLTFTQELTYTTVPEPSMMALGASGLATLLLMRRRR